MNTTWMKRTAGAALAVFAAFAQTAPVPQPQGERLQRMMRNRQQRIAQWLNLTPDQIQQIREIRRQARTEAQPVMAQLKAGRQSFRTP